MLRRLQQKALEKGFQIARSPAVNRMMTDPRVLEVVSRSVAMGGRLQEQMDLKLNQVAFRLNLARRSEVDELQRTVEQLQCSLNRLEREHENQSASEKPSQTP